MSAAEFEPVGGQPEIKGISEKSRNYICEQLGSRGLVLATSAEDADIERPAREIYTDVYLENGFIDQSNLETEGSDAGLHVDRYTSRSTYAMAANGRRVTACRYIAADESNGVESLPTLKNFNIDRRALARVAGHSSVDNIDPANAIELSGLAARRIEPAIDSTYNGKRPTHLLYSHLLRESLEEGRNLWVMNTDDNLIQGLQLLLGKKQITTLGEPQAYMGEATTPVAANPYNVVEAVYRQKSPANWWKRRFLTEVLNGMSDDNLTPELRKLLSRHHVKFAQEAETVQQPG